MHEVNTTHGIILQELEAKHRVEVRDLEAKMAILLARLHCTAALVQYPMVIEMEGGKAGQLGVWDKTHQKFQYMRDDLLHGGSRRMRWIRPEHVRPVDPVEEVSSEQVAARAEEGISGMGVDSDGEQGCFDDGPEMPT